MQAFCIGVGNGAHEMVTILQNEFNGYEPLKKAYSIDEIVENNGISIICKLKEHYQKGCMNGKIQKRFKYRMCNAIAEFIMKNYECRILERIVNCNYCYFSKSEKSDIIQKSMEIIDKLDKEISISDFYKRKSKIITRLTEYFESEESLILDGFINFRLKDYMEELEVVAEKAVEQYLTEREYHEFVKLLKYFIEMQEPAYDVINIIVDGNGMYRLLTKDGDDVTIECIREFELEMQDKKISMDDILISTLVSLAPEKIILHNSEFFKNAELLDTIKKVFDGRFTLCSTCQLCKKATNNYLLH